MRRDLIALADESKVWIYQADRALSSEELGSIQEAVIEFSHQWKSHGMELDCYTHVFHSRFLVFVADDTRHVSGCSIDSSVHFIQNLETKYGISFFDRLNYLYFNEGEIASVPHLGFKQAIEDGTIHADTLIFNNLVASKREFLDGWVTEVQNSWHSRYL